jgi:hypothetical protein
VSLKAAFLVLLSIACCKDASMVYYLEFSSDSHKWNINFIRAAHDWEVDLFTLFFNLLYSFKLRRGGKDKLSCTPCKRGFFDIRSFYKVRFSP